MTRPARWRSSTAIQDLDSGLKFERPLGRETVENEIVNSLGLRHENS
jgi:hypothetical protein